MNDFSPTIAGSGFNDVLAGAELFNVLRISHEDLVLSHNKDRLVDIAGFVNEFGDALPLMRMAMAKKPADVHPIDHIYSFVSLQKKRFSLKQQLSQLEKELSFYE